MAQTDPISITATLSADDSRIPRLLSVLYGGLDEEQRARTATNLLLEEARLHGPDTLSLVVDIDSEGAVRAEVIVDSADSGLGDGQHFAALSKLADLDLVRTSRRRSTAATVPGPVTERWLQQGSNNPT